MFPVRLFFQVEDYTNDALELQAIVKILWVFDHKKSL
ncbi:hypothetical protein SAMN04489724_2986 [Algoriphagus locisalis]|uniref:Uncharacterized protein n=1 Tax=Algoriphagus locisalis TaxID=305507 RepID=A0A1I7C9E5_9BACT|nr:hypothetical protein SAMN04489724_2986 [Algoriphagus locisalis]